MSRLKVLVLAPAAGAFGGVNSFAEMLCERLARQHEVHRIGVGRDQSHLPAPVRMVRDLWRLLAQVRRVRPDVVLLNPSFNKAIVREAISLTLMRLVHRGTFVVFNHGWGTTLPNRIDASTGLQRLARALFGAADRIFVLGQERRDILLRWGFSDQQVRAATTMYDPSPLVGVQRSRNPAGGTGSVRLLFLSRLAPGKGANELIDAFVQLRQRHVGLELVCAGDGPEHGVLLALARERGLEASLTLPGFVAGSAKAQALLDADIFVLPTQLNEGFPVSLLEAMGAGLPIVASGVGGVVDLFGMGAQGHMLAPRPTATEIAAALDTLIRDPARVAAAGAANRQLALRRFTADAWCADFAEELMTLVDHRRSRADLPVT
ncbi:MAG: glycosyltransferase family 4 protein [Aquabacterium sp.]